MAAVRRTCAVLVLALTGTELSAHDTWLSPAGPPPTGAGDIRLHLTSSGACPTPEHAITPGRLAVACVARATGRHDLRESAARPANGRAISRR